MSTDVEAASAASAERGRGALGWLLVLSLPLLMAAMELAVYAVEPRVLSPRNIVNILNQSSYLLLFASGQMVVILTRGFDLSLGTTVSAVSVASALAMTGLAGVGFSDPLVVAAGLAVGLGFGALVGVFNGVFVSRLGISPFIVTLGSLNICMGLATTMSGGRPVFNVPDAFSTLLYNGAWIPGDLDPADARDPRLRAALFPARPHANSAARFISSAPIRAPPISRACRASATSRSPMSRVPCSPRSAR